MFPLISLRGLLIHESDLCFYLCFYFILKIVLFCFSFLENHAAYTGVFGAWKVNKESKKFMVSTKRGKLFTINEGLKFEDVVQMVHKDFSIDRLGNELECLE